jgi:hypothetical protein
MDHTTKMAAALAAVTAYIQTEEEALCAQMAAAPAGAEPAGGAATAAAPVNLWGLSGRQTLMQMGTMMQMKAYHRH